MPNLSRDIIRRMSKIPKDLKKVHRKYEELALEKNEMFAAGFHRYMVEVDYRKRNPDEVLRAYIWSRRIVDFPELVDDVLSGEIESDLVKGFEFGKQYSQKVNYTYTD